MYHCCIVSDSSGFVLRTRRNEFLVLHGFRERSDACRCGRFSNARVVALGHPCFARSSAFALEQNWAEAPTANIRSRLKSIALDQIHPGTRKSSCTMKESPLFQRGRKRSALHQS